MINAGGNHTKRDNNDIDSRVVYLVKIMRAVPMLLLWWRSSPVTNLLGLMTG